MDPNNWITAASVNRGLEMLYHGELLSPAHTGYLLGAMTQVKPELGDLLGRTPGGILSHKNGFLLEDGSWVDNDAGIVRFYRGDVQYAYAITWMAQELDTPHADAPLARTITRITWEYFNARYP